MWCAGSSLASTSSRVRVLEELAGALLRARRAPLEEFAVASFMGARRWCRSDPSGVLLGMDGTASSYEGAGFGKTSKVSPSVLHCTSFDGLRLVGFVRKLRQASVIECIESGFRVLLRNSVSACCSS